MDYDVLVIGGGIAGLEAAINLGDMGYRVLLVEKEPSIGGKMILLSKVFPSLDCASCISTPKMALAVVSGFVMVVLRLLNLPLTAYLAFAVHLVIVFNVMISFPFTKFAHVIYRPVALWLAGVE